MIELLTIGALARRTGLAVSAIRFYESKGLVRATRNEGGHRRFSRSDVRRLSFVLIAQQFGFTIEQIKRELDRLPSQRAPTKADWARISRGFRHALNEKIDTLTRLRDDLDGCIGCGCLSLQSCRIYNADDRAAQGGTGPRYLIDGRPEFDRD